MKPPKGSHQLRSGRESIQGHFYFLTTSVHDRIPVLRDPPAADIVLNALKWLEGGGRIELVAAVVMPDHLHFIASLKQDCLARLMQSLKGYTSREINKLLHRKGALWQEQYYEHALRRDEDLNTAVRYMLNNPVRAGLVADFHAYPHWSCRWAV